MVNFEYKTISFHIDQDQNKVDVLMNNMGAQGWELVSTYSKISDGPNSSYTSIVKHVFKRQLPND